MSNSRLDQDSDNEESEDTTDASDDDGEDDAQHEGENASDESDAQDDSSGKDKPISEEDADYLLQLSALHGYYLSREHVISHLTERDFHEGVDLLRAMSIEKRGGEREDADEDEEEDEAEDESEDDNGGDR